MYKEHEIIKVYYTTGEAAIKLNLSTSKIRFWLKEMGITVKRMGNNRRLIDLQTLGNLEYIQLLVNEGYKLWAVKNKLKNENRI